MTHWTFAGAPGLVSLLVWLVVGGLVVALVVALVVVLARRPGPTPHVPPPADPQRAGSAPAEARTAREELDLRYARGEVTREEYLRIRADIEGA